MLTTTEVKRIQGTVAQQDERLPTLLGVLGDARRFHILKLLGRRYNVCVTDIAKIFDISVPAASQQLKILETAGFIVKERKGQSLCYKVRKSDPLVRSVMQLVVSKKGRQN